MFLMDLDGKMIAYPIKPELTEEKNLLQVADTAGKSLSLKFVQVASSKGQGWVDYMWPKPGEDKPVAKSSDIYRVSGTRISLARVFTNRGASLRKFCNKKSK